MPAHGQAPVQFGLPPVPGQAPMHPAPPFQAPPFGQRPNAAGNPVGAVFLGFLVSVVVSFLYSGINVATYKEQSLTTANILYLGHALLNGSVVGSLVGLVGRRSNGARIGAAVIAALGAFFGFANSLPLIIADSETPRVAWDLLQHEPFWPAKAWWNNETGGGVDWFSPLGLVIAAAAAWGLAYAIGNKRGRT
ncbi:hypothetical protein [Streptomyces cellostaticus]|nr:hypothetical protein [Streptomyces cellostaticus]